jgi:chromosomal replication initiator protein
MSPLRIADIKEEVAREFKLDRHDLVSERQTRDLTVPRHIAFKLTKLHTTYSLPRIGREFGGRDHTTIISGLRSIEKRMQQEPELKDRFDIINARLEQLAAPNSEEEAGEPSLSD